MKKIIYTLIILNCISLVSYSQIDTGYINLHSIDQVSIQAASINNTAGQFDGVDGIVATSSGGDGHFAGLFVNTNGSGINGQGKIGLEVYGTDKAIHAESSLGIGLFAHTDRSPGALISTGATKGINLKLYSVNPNFSGDSMLFVAKGAKVLQYVNGILMFSLTSSGHIISPQILISSASITSSQITTIVGKTPSVAGAGYQVTLKNILTGDLYKVESDGINWYYIMMTIVP